MPFLQRLQALFWHIYLFETIFGYGLNGIFIATGLGQFAGMIVGIGFYLSGKWRRIIIKEAAKN